jgi:hypothetical protein
MPQTAQQQLDAVNTAIDARLAGGVVEEVDIRGQRIKLMPMRDLLALRATLQAEVAQESGGGGVRHLSVENYR